jgi:hypothetical protein
LEDEELSKAIEESMKVDFEDDEIKKAIEESMKDNSVEPSTDKIDFSEILPEDIDPAILEDDPKNDEIEELIAKVCYFKNIV